MNGSAPNSPATGFHSRPARKPSPKRLIESTALDAIAPIIVARSAMSSSATAKSAARKTASPTFPVGASDRRQSHARTRAPYSLDGPTGAGVDIKEEMKAARRKDESAALRDSLSLHPCSLHPSSLLSERLPAGSYRVELRLDLTDYLSGERRVGEVSGVLLAVVHGPPEEVNERLALQGILLILVDEDVGVARNRIRACAAGVRDRDAQVFGRGGERFGGGGGHAVERWLDEVAGGVLH